jgi:hypothetical protein
MTQQLENKFAITNTHTETIGNVSASYSKLSDPLDARDLFREPSIFEKTVNVAISSAKIESIQVEEPAQIYDLRPQLHIFVSAPYGSFKSTLLESIEKAIPNSKYRLQMTSAALRGTFDKNTGEPIGFLAWDVRNSVLLMDEIGNDARGQLLRALLALTENQRYDFSLGMKTPKELETKDEDLFLKIDNGNVSIRTRFTAIFATMYSFEYIARSLKMAALLDRTVAIRYDLEQDERYRVEEGNPIYVPRLYEVPKKIFVSIDNWQLIIDYARKKYPDLPQTRAINNCIRVFAVTGEHNLDLYDYILDSNKNLRDIQEKIIRERERNIDRNY